MTIWSTDKGEGQNSTELLVNLVAKDFCLIEVFESWGSLQKAGLSLNFMIDLKCKEGKEDSWRVFS